MTSKSFYEWAEVVAQEKNLSLEDVMMKVGTALKKACALEGFKGDVQVEFNYEKKEIKIQKIEAKKAVKAEKKAKKVAKKVKTPKKVKPAATEVKQEVKVVKTTNKGISSF